jgi:hypothetical protein
MLRLVATVVGATPWLAGSAAAQQPASPHGALPEGLDCSACHTVQGWKPARSPMAFRHEALSGFQLEGAHAKADCRGCHVDLRFDGPELSARDCASCHVDVHEGRMVEGCASCHTTVAFRDVDGDRVHARTSFPLTGAHQQLTCETCHTDDRGGAFSALPTDCVSCHQADYRSARSVDHLAAGYPTDCTGCHATVAWSETPVFDHAILSRGFQLLGAHARTACASCHAQPGFTLLFPQPTGQEDCVACHQREYDARHAGSGFSTRCLDCHAIDQWEGATFDHASAARGFRLRGPHASASCASCHTTPSSFAVFTCLSCHEHRQTAMDDKHKERPGYVYESSACLNCHRGSL